MHLPPIVNPLEYLQMRELRDRALDTTDPIEIVACIAELETMSPLARLSETPHTLCPFHLPADADTAALAGAFGGLLSAGQLDRLLEGGFVPELARPAESRIGAAPVIGEHDDHALVDVEYGVAILPVGGAINNWPLTEAPFDRYLTREPLMAGQPAQAVLSLGALRGRSVWPETRPGSSKDMIEFRVRTRKELDRLIETIEEGCARSGRFQLWFRGQDRDRHLSDFTDPAFLSICPWREIRDTSLVPSLYREMDKRLADLHGYVETLAEIGEYVFAMRQHLDLIPYTRRDSIADDVEDRIPEGWLLGQAEPSARLSSSDGSWEQVRDYHFAFFNAQQSFFLQHYGLPSTLLDITVDPSAALFFAQHRVAESGAMVPVAADASPVLQVYLLDAEMDMFFATHELLRDEYILRPLRQKAGALVGASFVTRNAYSRLLSFKIHLDEAIPFGGLTAGELFPPPDEDAFLEELLGVHETLGLRHTKPFRLAEPPLAESR